MALLNSGWLFLFGACLASFRGIEGQREDADVVHQSRGRLFMNLLKVHNPLVIPRTPVNVSYNLQILRVVGVDENERLLRIATLGIAQWRDHRFQWNISEYNGISRLNIPAKLIWKPDLRAYAQSSEVEEVKLIVYSDGTVSHVYPMRLAISCSMSFAYYPYDSHTCSFKVGSWTYDGSMVNLQLKDQGYYTSTSYVDEHAAWRLVSVEATHNLIQYACCPEPFIKIVYSFTLRRQPTEYRVRVLAPSIATSLLILTSFLIPHSALGQRIVLCSVLILCCLVQLMHLNLTVPFTTDDAPYLAKFLCFSVFLAFCALVESVISLNVAWGIWGDGGNTANRQNEEELPGLQVKPNTANVRIARVLDLGCFVLFTFIFAIVGGVLLN